jgi:hypothetical protein
LWFKTLDLRDQFLLIYYSFFIQEEIQKLAPLQSQLDDALVQVKSLEAMKVWLECHQKETEDRIKSTETYYEDVMEHLKAEHDKELSQLKIFYENHDKVIIVYYVL